MVRMRALVSIAVCAIMLFMCLSSYAQTTRKRYRRKTYSGAEEAEKVQYPDAAKWKKKTSDRRTKREKEKEDDEGAAELSPIEYSEPEADIMARLDEIKTELTNIRSDMEKFKKEVNEELSIIRMRVSD
ncbi:hypothetical protein ACFL42_02475 [Candidatus Omnitrophota bacterium]